ncbi:cobalamin biosynthesis protein [Paractinoplanes toevensis]|uniref:cobalamin biosynthesis protein n=1 Tax=Paractinoplanes toevensis TaxID=571911 RepID=UPI001BB3087E|nr:cobalamin biosynthesis protein [Actinoplanes toevensis]
MTGSRGLVVGLGARAGRSAEVLVAAVLSALSEVGAGPGDVRVLATLDRRSAEDGVRAVAVAYGWELVSFAAAQLAAQAVPNASERVAAAVGTPGVAEAAALAAAGSGAVLVLPKRVFAGVVVAVASTLPS